MSLHDECPARIGRLQQQIQQQQLDGALFLYPIDIYYFTGTRQNGMLWVPAEGDAKLLIRKSLSRARLDAVSIEPMPFPSSRELSGIIGQPGQRIGTTFDVLPVTQLSYLKKVLPEREFLDVSAVNRELRSVKSLWEIDKIRFSGRQLSKVFSRVPDFLTEGMREIDLAAAFEESLRRLGGEGFVRMRAFNQELFQGLAVASGAEHPGFFDGAVTGNGLSAAAPHGASTAIIKRDTPILIDYAGIFDGYIVDMTRMFVVGNLHPDLQKAFDVACTIQNQLVDLLKPGNLCSDLFAVADSTAREAGLGDKFMGPPGEQAKFVGHGLGLELDEMPVLAKGFDVPLAAGQTIAIEPKFILPGLGAIGIENTFAVTEQGGDRLSDLPDDVIAVVP
ncbi:MAG: aminopeptidase P family protein [Desulfuromonas sp.]|nr:MAG: aminopeptidase P family protein [Desulfuromonas sp.]